MEIGITQYFNILLKTLGDVTKKVVGKDGGLIFGGAKKEGEERRRSTFLLVGCC